MSDNTNSENLNIGFTLRPDRAGLMETIAAVAMSPDKNLWVQNQCFEKGIIYWILSALAFFYFHLQFIQYLLS